MQHDSLSDPLALLKQRQVAELTGLSERKLEAARLRGIGIPYVRFSKRCIRYRRGDVDSHVASLVVRTASANS